jgi:hypothetical protein
MGIAIASFNGLFSPLQAALGWLVGAAPVHSRSPRRPSAGHASAPHSIAACARPMRTTTKNTSPMPVARPLRVLRVVDAGHAPASAGRMVISGRMADVCAELDRLAALEAARH